MIALHDRQVSLDNIQRRADFFKLKVSDLLSARRNRSIARPRQIAMALAKELTSHSLPEIGEAFGGRDHTTVLHACRKVKELLNTDTVIKADYDKLFKSLADKHSMDFTISREHFLERANMAAAVVERKHTLPILANVLLVVDVANSALTGTDLDTEISIELEVDQVREGGEITLAVSWSIF